MAINNVTDLKNSCKQYIQFTKTATATTTTSSWWAVEELAGFPTGGLSMTLTGGGLTSGIVPTDATGGDNVGYPKINNFGVGATGYLSQVEINNNLVSRVRLYDKLFVAGSYNTNAAVSQTLTGQPSFSTRLVNGSYAGLQVWAQAATAFTGTVVVNLGYLNESGAAKTTSIAVSGAARGMYQFALGSGDKGVQQITTISSSIGTAGLYNVLIMRPILTGRIRQAGNIVLHSLTKTAMPPIFQDSALTVLMRGDGSLNTGLIDIEMVIASN